MTQDYFLPFLLLLKYTFLNLFLETGYPVTAVSWSNSATKWHHPLRRIDDSVLLGIGTSDTSHYDDFNSTLDAILVPRVPDTDGHTLVRQYILKQMNALGWSVTQDQFMDRTPHGRKSFANIIATADSRACRRLVVACHYDSLYNREYTFLGATDSAVPCAMMLHTAKMLNPLLEQQKANSPNKEVTLQFIFFDGEEAFKRWSRTDSLYGSRHLANKWNKLAPFEESGSRNCRDRDYVSYLDRLDVIVLLDLIGTANPKFYSYFLDTHSLYLQLVDAEQRLNSLKLLETHPPEGTTNYFSSTPTLAYVEDDHVPFMRKGVPIVHLIPSPFPHVWHKESDNRASLHHPTINNLNKILRTFIAQYLHLDVPKEPLIM